MSNDHTTCLLKNDHLSPGDEIHITQPLNIKDENIAHSAKRPQLLKTILLITATAVILGSLYLTGSRQDNECIRRTHLLCEWYFLSASMNTFVGYAVQSTLPFYITSWASRRLSYLLWLYIILVGWVFRSIWYYDIPLRRTFNRRKPFLTIWTAINNINLYFTVPYIVWKVYLLNPRSHKLSSKRSLILRSSDSFSELDSTRESFSSQSPRCCSSWTFGEVLLFSAYCLCALTNTIESLVRLWYKGDKFWPLWRFPAILFLFLVIHILSKSHMRTDFFAFVSVCCFLPIQLLFIHWMGLVLLLIHETSSWNPVVARFMVFLCQLVFFKVVSGIGNQLCRMMDKQFGGAHDFKFIFICFYELFIFLYITLAAATIGWELVVVFFAMKLSIKVLLFYKPLREKIGTSKLLCECLHIPSNETLVVEFVYFILSSFVVYIGSAVFVGIDYLQFPKGHASYEYWIIPSQKGIAKLFEVWSIIGLLFALDLVTYGVVSWMTWVDSVGKRVQPSFDGIRDMVVLPRENAKFRLYGWNVIQQVRLHFWFSAAVAALACIRSLLFVVNCYGKATQCIFP